MSTIWDRAVRALLPVLGETGEDGYSLAYYCGDPNPACTHTTCAAVSALAEADLLHYPAPPDDQQEAAAENTSRWPDPVRSALETEALTSWAAVPGRDAWLTTPRDGYVAGYTIARCTRKDRP